MNTKKLNIIFIILIVILIGVVYNQQQEIKILQDTTAGLTKNVKKVKSDVNSLEYRIEDLESTKANNEAYVQDLESRLSDAEMRVSEAEDNVSEAQDDIQDIEGYSFGTTDLGDLDDRLNEVEDKLNGDGIW